LRPTWAEVDLDAITHNAEVLCRMVAPAELCAVVKAWAYGHGPVEAAEAALRGGASWLGVALVEEGRQLRAAGVTAPILVLSEPPVAAFADVVAHDLVPTIYTFDGIEAAAKAVVQSGRAAPLPAHVKVDTGMHRVGADPRTAVAVARAVAAQPELELQGLYTHFAVADEPARDDFTQGQLAAFTAVVAELATAGIRPPLTHAANSAGAIAHPEARLDLVRCGIALYGHAPSTPLAEASRSLRPALSLKARVSYVKHVEAGESISYGLRYTLKERTVVATVPIGYADGVPRRLSECGGEVLVGGMRRPIAGTVTMDQLTVDCGPDADVAVGDEVVLIGRQGDTEVTAWEWADRLGTIPYEVLCGVSQRVPRTYPR
jgi:alanine racemase